MRGWLRRWWAGRSSASWPDSPGDGAPALHPVESTRGQATSPRAKGGRLDLAAWSGLELSLPRPIEPGLDCASGKEDEQVAALLPLVREHFALHRPDPASFPSLATRVIDLVEQPEVDVNKLVHVVGQDSAISAKVLRVANSAAYRRSAEVEDLRAAVTLLGLREVANIAVGVAGRSLFDMEARAEFELFARHWNRLYHQSMTTAFSAGWLALDRRVRSDQAFLAGMFHDIGKSIALRSLSSLIVSGRLPARCSDRVAERILDEVHVELGVQMHAAWKMPRYLTFVCQHHHAPRAEAREEYAVLHVVRVASGLNLLRWSASDALAEQVSRSITALRLAERQVRTLGTQIVEFHSRVAGMFNIPLDPDGPSRLREDCLPTQH